jgi:hypothetical protein
MRTALRCYFEAVERLDLPCGLIDVDGRRHRLLGRLFHDPVASA